MRNISFYMTKKQIRARTKTVTRRMGWDFLEPMDKLQGCDKCQGLGKGGKIVHNEVIVVVDVRKERLDRMITEPEYGAEEVIKEGFPEMMPAEFVAFYCKGHKGCEPSSSINRIEFAYLD